MAAVPDQIVLRRHRDLEGRRGGIRRRRGMVVLLSVFVAAGLFNVFGQRPENTLVAANGVSFQLHAPSALRGGLLYEASFRIQPSRTLSHPVLVLAPGWAITEQINSLEPSPVSQASHNGQIALGLGPIRAGTTYTLFGEFQVNPTSVGWWPGDVSLYEGNKRLIHIDREIVVFP